MPQPIVIIAKIVPVRPMTPPSRVVPMDPPRYLPPPVAVAPPMPEFQAAAPNARPVPPPAPPKDERVQPDRARPGPPAPPPPANYISLLLAHLNAYKRYPYGARLHHEQGTVRLEFVMDRAGNVLSYRVVGSSGFADLDDEAREMIQNAQPMPPVPPNYPGTTLDLVLPLVFSLRS
ncbi:MAG TPA: energy transducer TonB [Rhizomicrobium sp.]|jgi:protein TonB|nr:energy transducer TonB [Rhizomicrobium sp.]